MKKKSNYYLEIRKKHGLSREKASELMDTLSPEKIEKIENEKQAPTPMDIMEMAAGYEEPSMRNYYCAHDCPMGQYYVPSIEFKELEKTVLQMVAALNSMHSMQERLIAISADGKIDGDEIRDFVRIQKELERISMATDSMQLYTKLLTDISQIQCIDGKLYISPILDCFNGEILSLIMRDNMKKELCIDTLKAARMRYPISGATLHSDYAEKNTMPKNCRSFAA